METVYVNGQPSVVSINVNQPGVVSVNQPSTSVVNVSKDFNVNLVDPELSFSPLINDFYIADSNGLPVSYIETGFASSFNDVYLNISNTAYMDGDIIIERKSQNQNLFAQAFVLNEPSAGWGGQGVDQTFTHTVTFTPLDSFENYTYRAKVRYVVGGSELFVYKEFDINSRAFARFYSSSFPVHSTIQDLDSTSTLLKVDGDYDNLLSYRPPLWTQYLYILIPQDKTIEEVSLSSADFGISDFTYSIYNQNDNGFLDVGNGINIFLKVYRVLQPNAFDGKRTLRIKLS